MTTLSTARRNVLQVATLEEKTRLEMAVEAGVEIIVQDLIEQGQRSSWLTPGHQGKLTFDGPVDARVIDVRGLMDINFSDIEMLDHLLSDRLGTVRAALAVERLKGHRARGTAPWGTYADMAAALELTVEQLACLLPNVTLFSLQEQPDSRLVPASLKKLFRLHEAVNSRSAITEENLVSGQTYKIIVSTSGSSPVSAHLVTEVLLTGRSDRPFILRSWAWLPAENEGATCNSP